MEVSAAKVRTRPGGAASGGAASAAPPASAAADASVLVCAQVPDDIPLLQRLVMAGDLITTPAQVVHGRAAPCARTACDAPAIVRPQDYDDSYCITYARAHGGVILTNDMYRDHVQARTPARVASAAALTARACRHRTELGGKVQAAGVGGASVAALARAQLRVCGRRPAAQPRLSLPAGHGHHVSARAGSTFDFLLGPARASERAPRDSKTAPRTLGDRAVPCAPRRHHRPGQHCRGAPRRLAAPCIATRRLGAGHLHDAATCAPRHASRRAHGVLLACLQCQAARAKVSNA